MDHTHFLENISQLVSTLGLFASNRCRIDPGPTRFNILLGIVLVNTMSPKTVRLF